MTARGFYTLLFGALMGQPPKQDCYDTASPILNAETI